MPQPTLPTQTVPELTSRLRLAVTRLARVLRQQSAEGDITASQLAALATIERDGPITLGALAAQERVQPPSMTRIVAALEDLGLVERAVDPADRRIARAHITARGRRYIERTRNRKNAYLAARLRDLDAEDVAALERAVPIIERLLGDGS